MTAPPQDNRATRYQCPECPATCVIDGIDTLIHRDSCPVADAIDDVASRDIQWFHDHPAAPHRWRPLDLIEYGELLTVGADVGQRWRAFVRPHPAGVERTLCRDGQAVLVVIDAPKWAA